MTYTPHRYSAKSVYRFVPVIKQVLDHHKARGIAHVSFDPSHMGISLETGIARLRDAVHSLSTGLTKHPQIDANTLKEVWTLYKVTSDGVKVMVVSRETEQDDPVPILTESNSVLATLQTNDTRFVETVTAFAVLLGQRFLSGTVTINGDLSDNLQRQLQGDNDVVIVQDSPNQYHMF